MKTIADLHMHSNLSDGSMSREDLIKRLLNTDAKAFSITDHDTIAKTNQTLCETKKILQIPGVELTTHLGNLPIHLLVYYPLSQTEKVGSIAALCMEKRKERFQKMICWLKTRGLDLQPEENSFPSTSILAKLAWKQKGIKTRDFYEKYLVKSLCLDAGYHDFPELFDILSTLEGKSVCILAHPGITFYKKSELLEDLLRQGLDGFETIHPANNATLRRYYKNLAHRFLCLQTGGSDFHDDSAGAARAGKMGLDHNQFHTLFTRIQHKLELAGVSY